MSQMAQGLPASATSQVSAAPVVTGSSRVPEHPVDPVSPPKVQKWLWIQFTLERFQLVGLQFQVQVFQIPTFQVTLERFQLVRLQLQIQVVQVLVLEVRLGKFQLEMFQFPVR